MEKGAILQISRMSAENELTEINGVQYSVKDLHKIARPSVKPLTVHTLSGLCDYGNTMDANGLVAHVVDHNFVNLISDPHEIEKTRNHYISAGVIVDCFRFDHYYDVESFIIKLQSMFVQSVVTESILKLVGNITAKAEQKTMDDGVTQTVTAKTGIALIEDARIPNPVVLAPFRTFTQIEQPKSKFVLRIKQSDGSFYIALFEADGGAWKETAIMYIADYLKENLPEGTLVIA